MEFTSKGTPVLKPLSFVVGLILSISTLKQRYNHGQNISQGWINLLLRARSGAQNHIQCARLIEKQLEPTIFVLCYLNRTCSFHFYCNFIKYFCNEAFAV